MEVIIVVVIIALVSMVLIRGISNPNERLTLQETEEVIAKAFTNATVRAQAFNEEIKVSLTPGEDKAITISLKNIARQTNTLPMAEQEKTEEDIDVEHNKKSALFAWGGEDSYKLPKTVKIIDYEELVDDEGMIHFSFYPDGEASGPDLTLEIGKRRFHFSVDRLNSQFNLQAEKE